MTYQIFRQQLGFMYKLIMKSYLSFYHKKYELLEYFCAYKEKKQPSTWFEHELTVQEINNRVLVE